MTKKVLLATLVVVLAGGMILAASNRDRDLRGTTTTLTVIGTCEPETDPTAVGWDKTPTPGNWGGRPEAQFAVVWEPGVANGTQVDLPDFPILGSGRFAKCTIPGVTTLIPKAVEVESLRGMGNDDYCVFASVGSGKLILIGCYDETSSTEVWGTQHFHFQRVQGFFASGQDVTVWILATGNAWPSFSTWGQLAVDKITIKGNTVTADP